MPYVRRNWQNAPSSATPLNAAALNNIEDGVEAATEAIANLPATYVSVSEAPLNPARYGTVDPTGAVDSWAAIQAALTAASASSFPRKAVQLQPGNYRITGGDLTYDRSVDFLGSGSAACRLSTFDAGPNRKIIVKGEVDLNDNWITRIGGMSLYKIGILGGETIDDWAPKFHLSDLDIAYATNAIEARYHSWAWVMSNINVHHCGRGFYANFTGVRAAQDANVAASQPAGTGSGAAMEFHGFTAQDCSIAGFHQADNALDGSHFTFLGGNLEHNATSVLLEGLDGGSNVVELNGTHFELNSNSYIKADSGSVWVRDPWMFALQGGSKVAYFDLSGTAKAWLSGGRVHWDAATSNYLHKITDTASLSVNPRDVQTSDAWALVTPDSYPGIPGHPDGTVGMKVASGPLAGKLSLSQALTTTNYTFVTVPPGDATAYEFEFDVEVTSAGSDNSYALTVDPGAVVSTALTFPASVNGHAKVKVRWSRTATRWEWFYSNGTGGRGVTATAGLALSSRVSFSFRKTGTNNSTANLRSPMVTALAVNA